MYSMTRILPALLLMFLFGAPIGAQSRVIRPTLGVSLHTEGLAVESVDPGSLGARAGIRPGDFLTHWGERPVADIEAVIAARDSARAGSTAILTVFRATEREELPLTLPDPIPEAGLVLGVNIGAGLYVATVAPNTPASRAGIKPGDILASLGGQPITDVVSLRAILDGVRWGQSRQVVLHRGAEEVTLKVEFPAPERISLATPLAPTEPAQRGRLAMPPSLRWTESIFGLDELKKELDDSVAELRELADPRLDAVIRRLEVQSAKLNEVAGTVEKMKLFGGHLRDDLEELQDFPFGDRLDFGELQKRMESLMERHGDDLDALRRALGNEFPGMDVFIDGQPGHMEFKIETKDEPDADPATPKSEDEDDQPARLQKRSILVVPGGETAPVRKQAIEVAPRAETKAEEKTESRKEE